MTDQTPPLPPPPDTFSGPPLAPAPPPSADRPSAKQALVLFVAMAVIAGGSCAGFLSNMRNDASGVFALLFLAALPLAGAAFTLTAFRLGGFASRDGWPSPLQCFVIVGSGLLMAVVGCGGWAATMESVVPLAFLLGAVFVGGGLFAMGGLILLFSPVFRAIAGSKAAR